MLRPFLAASMIGAIAAGAQAQTLMVVESTNDTVMLVDGFDGTVINPLFIDLSVASASTPVEALVVGNEIWISDQLDDGFIRFTLDGTTYLGNITGTMDNTRGFEVRGNEVLLANAGTNNGAPGDAVVTLDATTASVTGSWPAGDPFDVLDYDGNLLLSNILDEDLDIHAYDGTFVAKFHDSDGITGIDFPEQVCQGNGLNVLAAGFSSPSGIYEYDATGAQINYYDTGAIGGQTGLRGVHQLGNGNILYTSGTGLYILDPINLSSTSVVTGIQGRYISVLETGGPPSDAYCFGDGTGTICPCGNTGTAGRGCENGANTGGGLLSRSGSSSIAAGGLVLSGSGLIPGQPGLYFQGDNATAGGNGFANGDGLRCAGGNVRRLQIRTANAQGESSTTIDIGLAGAVNAGDVKRYQLWYRDPVTTVCGTTFNLTNGVEVTWQP